MRGFNFKFETLLKHREREKGSQEMRLASAEFEVFRVESTLENIREERWEKRKVLVALQKDDNTDSAEIADYYGYIDHLNRSETNAVEQLKEKIREKEKIRLDLIEASRKEKVVTRLREHHMLGNDMRLRFDGAIKLDARWRRELTEKELQAFSQNAGKMNRRFGYE